MHLYSWVSPALTVMMPLFVLACGMLLPTYLNRLKMGELERLQSSHPGIADTLAFRVAAQANDRFSLWHYAIPVAFTTFQVSIMAYITYFGATFPNLMRDFLLGGADVINNPDYQTYAMTAMCTIAFAFLGAFIWMIQNLIARIMARNINPATFYAMSINMLLAVVVAAVLHHIYHGGIDVGLGLPNATDAPAIMIGIGFLTGLSPDIALEKIRNGLKFTRKDGMSPPLPVTLLQGITPNTEFRLKEMALDNVQALAQANPVELFMMTPGTIQCCLDWVGQAQLYLIFGDKTSTLAPFGIRTILDLHRSDAPLLVGPTGWSEQQVVNAKQRLEQNPAFTALKQISDLLLNDTTPKMSADDDGNDPASAPTDTPPAAPPAEVTEPPAQPPAPEPAPVASEAAPAEPVSAPAAAPAPIAATVIDSGDAATVIDSGDAPTVIDSGDAPTVVNSGDAPVAVMPLPSPARSRG